MSLYQFSNSAAARAGIQGHGDLFNAAEHRNG